VRGLRAGSRHGERDGLLDRDQRVVGVVVGGRPRGVALLHPELLRRRLGGEAAIVQQGADLLDAPVGACPVAQPVAQQGEALEPEQVAQQRRRLGRQG